MTARKLALAAAIAALVTMIASALTATGAAADGLPVVGVDTTSEGVLAPGGEHRYLAVAAGDRTVVAEVAPDGGEITGERVLAGRFAVPGVSLDGTTSGLSRDGSTLVLIRPRESFPQRETSMVVLDPGRLQVRSRIALDGDFSFDALSPDGRTMYLVEYVDPRDPTHYRVRAFDLSTGRLVPGAIVDASQPDEQMRGYPQTRVTGLDGRWEYTLYDGGGDEPFVHALDTVAARSVCIDMPWIDPRQVGRIDLELSGDGSTIAVVDPKSGPVAEIDTAGAEATEVVASDQASAASEGGGSGIEIVAIGAALIVLAALAASMLRRRRARGADVVAGEAVAGGR